MRVPGQKTFSISLTSDHLAVVLEGLAELPYKKSNALIKYIQQQMQIQLQEEEAVNARNEEAARKAAEIESEIEQIREEDPKLATAIDKSAARTS